MDRPKWMPICNNNYYKQIKKSGLLSSEFIIFFNPKKKKNLPIKNYSSTKPYQLMIAGFINHCPYNDFQCFFFNLLPITYHWCVKSYNCSTGSK